MSRFALGVAPLLLATAGCTVLLKPGEMQCETAKDCEARGFSGAVCNAGVCEQEQVVDPVWGCLGHVDNPTPDPTKKVDLDVQLVLAGDKSPVPGATVDVCAKIDLDCTGTNPDFPKGIMSDADGNVKLSLVQGFDGFVRISATGIMDSRVFVGRPIVKPPTPKAVWLLKTSDYNILAAFAGLTPDPTRGSAIFFGVDCQGIGASGVSFTCPNADDQSQQFYLINQAPSAPPTAKATDVDGYGGYFNLPVGTAVGKSYREKDMTYIGESSFQVLANTISYVQISPTPN